jgi:predicted GNAT family acetyltransferase
VAKIGLIAVNDAHRGKGVASRLLAAIGRWMVGQGAKISTVATQGDNWPARRCFERAGYAVQSSLHLHHLWREGDGR